MKSFTRQQKQLMLLLTPTTLFLGIFFIGPLLIMAVYSFLEPGLYGGVEWNFYHWNYGRILGWADGFTEEFDWVYLEIFLRSIGLALGTVFCTLLISTRTLHLFQLLRKYNFAQAQPLCVHPLGRDSGQRILPSSDLY